MPKIQYPKNLSPTTGKILNATHTGKLQLGNVTFDCCVLENGARNLPPYFGGLTNDLIYDRLAPGILEELKRTLPKDDQGRCEGYFHQKLTVDIGNPKLREHIASVVTLMKLSADWSDFKNKLDQIHPKYMLNMFNEDQIFLF